jgi:hypothetical protein
MGRGSVRSLLVFADQALVGLVTPADLARGARPSTVV